MCADQAAEETKAEATPEAGPWIFTLDFPSYMPVMTHSVNRHLPTQTLRFHHNMHIPPHASYWPMGGNILSKIAIGSLQT